MDKINKRLMIDLKDFSTYDNIDILKEFLTELRIVKDVHILDELFHQNLSINFDDPKLCEICNKNYATNTFVLHCKYNLKAPKQLVGVNCECCDKCHDFLTAGVFPLELMNYIKLWIKTLRNCDDQECTEKKENK